MVYAVDIHTDNKSERTPATAKLLRDFHCGAGTHSHITCIRKLLPTLIHGTLCVYALVSYGFPQVHLRLANLFNFISEIKLRSLNRPTVFFFW